MRAELYDNGWARKRRRKERKKEGRRVFHRDCIGVALIISPVAGTPCLRSTRVFCRFYRFVGLFNLGRAKTVVIFLLLNDLTFFTFLKAWRV